MSKIAETLDADLKALEIYLKLGYTKNEHKMAFENIFNTTPSIVNREKGTIEISKEAFLNKNIPPVMINAEIRHFDFHVRDRKLRRKLSGKQIQTFIDFLIENKLFNYAEDYKKKFWFKLLINKILKCLELKK